jgi:hypothetical protein
MQAVHKLLPEQHSAWIWLLLMFALLVQIPQSLGDRILGRDSKWVVRYHLGYLYKSYVTERKLEQCEKHGKALLPKAFWRSSIKKLIIQMPVQYEYGAEISKS